MTSVTVDRLARSVRPGYGMKTPVIVASTANLTLSGTTQTIDGVAVSTGRILAKNQTLSHQNGIYDVGSGSWDRAKDWDGNGDAIWGTLVPVISGNTYANQVAKLTSTGAGTAGDHNIGTTSESMTFQMLTTFGSSLAVPSTTLFYDTGLLIAASSSTDRNFRFSSTAITSTATRVLTVPEGSFTITGTTLVQDMRFNSVLVSSAAVFSTGTVTAPSITFSGATDTGFYTEGANDVALALNGGLVFQVNSTRQVTFGTANSSSTNIITLTNTGTGGTANDAELAINAGNATGGSGNAVLSLRHREGAATSWHIGKESTNNDLVVNYGSTFDSSAPLRITTAGVATWAKAVAFSSAIAVPVGGQLIIGTTGVQTTSTDISIKYPGEAGYHLLFHQIGSSNNPISPITVGKGSYDGKLYYSQAFVTSATGGVWGQYTEVNHVGGSGGNSAVIGGQFSVFLKDTLTNSGGAIGIWANGESSAGTTGDHFGAILAVRALNAAASIQAIEADLYGNSTVTASKYGVIINDSHTGNVTGTLVPANSTTETITAAFGYAMQRTSSGTGFAIGSYYGAHGTQTESAIATTGTIIYAGGSTNALGIDFMRTVFTDAAILLGSSQKIAWRSSNGATDATFKSTGGAITVNRALLGSSGGSTAPSFAFSADADVGVWLPGGNTGGLAAGGVESLRWDSNFVDIRRSVLTLGATTAEFNSTGGKVTLTQPFLLSGQPSFLAILSSNVSSITGDSTNYTILFDSVPTNRGSMYASSDGLCTVVVPGIYSFNAQVRWQDNSSATRYDTELVTSNRTYVIGTHGAGMSAGAGAGFSQGGSVLANMSSGHTAYVRVFANGSTLLNEGIYGGVVTWFSGQLVA